MRRSLQTVEPTSDQAPAQEAGAGNSFSAGAVSAEDAFQAMSEYLARHGTAPSGSARTLQEALEKSLNNPDMRPNTEAAPADDRWPTWVRTLLILATAGAFWGGLIWLFTAIFR